MHWCYLEGTNNRVCVVCTRVISFGKVSCEGASATDGRDQRLLRVDNTAQDPKVQQGGLSTILVRGLVARRLAFKTRRRK